MLSRFIAALAAVAWGALDMTGGPAAAEAAQRISGPRVHEGLAIYLVHGASAAGAVPLTLDEALAGGRVQVIETGQVNELKIENTSDEEVFVQAGDIVKGGRQDRVLTVSLLLPPRSGAVPIASFCVEAGRWSGRAGEDAGRFTSAGAAMPSRQALLAMAEPAKPAPHPAPAQHPARGEQRVQSTQNFEGGRRSGDYAGTASRQRQVWDSVARTQAKLSAGLGTRVNAPQSETSLQLSLEHEALKTARAAYLAALEAEGMKGDDIVGYVAAINGKPVSANVYPSNGLFRKVWARQLAAVVTEALGERQAAPPPAPAVADVEAFLVAAETGLAHERATTADMRQETREASGALYSEARRAGGAWVHKNYLAK